MSSQAFRIAVIGRRGLLAQALQAAARDDVTVQCFGRADLDLLSENDARACLGAAQPHAVINAAAYTAVDKAENEPVAAYALNRDAPALLARATAERGLPFIHVSTDYVFDGDKGAAYGEEDFAAPLSLYGQSKHAGEQAVMAAHPGAVIARTAWLMGPWRRCFPHVMLTLAQKRDAISVVADQRGSPTLADPLARALMEVARMRARGEGAAGLLHMAGSQPARWSEIAELVCAEAQKCGAPTARVQPTTLRAYGALAARPMDSRLDCSQLLRDYGLALPGWEAGVAALVRDVVGLGAPAR